MPIHWFGCTLGGPRSGWGVAKSGEDAREEGRWPGPMGWTLQDDCIAIFFLRKTSCCPPFLTGIWKIYTLVCLCAISNEMPQSRRDLGKQSPL